MGTYNWARCCGTSSRTRSRSRHRQPHPALDDRRPGRLRGEDAAAVGLGADALPGGEEQGAVHDGPAHLGVRPPEEADRPAARVRRVLLGLHSTSTRPTATTSSCRCWRSSGRPAAGGRLPRDHRQVDRPISRTTSSPGARSRSRPGATTRRRARSTTRCGRRRERAGEVPQYDEAITAWEEIAKLRPVDALPHQRLAGLLPDSRRRTTRRSSTW